ncbi:MAG TPA: NAD(P)-dependent oxidoreductase [Burkholderiaceae bacterium]|nr:NAD(P)-dependent oxidoreductase [Burkholderiaceae bacterium]
MQSTTVSSMCRIGFIGIGSMGMAMARNLHRRGFPVTVRDIRAEAERTAQALGMTAAASPASLMKTVDLAIIVVVNAQQIDEVVSGAGGIVSAAADGKTVMICSTIDPGDTMQFAERLARHGINVIDAPVSGGPVRAEAGTMSMMLAGDEKTIARNEPILAALSDKQFYLGSTIGDGAKAKLVNNLLAGVNLVAGAEALALATKIGLDPHKLFDVICASSGASWIFQDRMVRALQDDFEPRAFAHILTKDISLATAMADAAQCVTPLGDAALTIFRETVARGWGEFDDAAVLKTYLDAKRG